MPEVGATGQGIPQLLKPPGSGHHWVFMDDNKLKLLLQDAEEHLRQRSCRARYEAAAVRLPDSRRNIRFGETGLYDKAG